MTLMQCFFTGLGISYLLSMVLIMALCRAAHSADERIERYNRIRRIVEGK